MCMCMCVVVIIHTRKCLKCVVNMTLVMAYMWAVVSERKLHKKNLVENLGALAENTLRCMN